jgi:hypothetical protein
MSQPMTAAPLELPGLLAVDGPPQAASVNAKLTARAGIRNLEAFTFPP